MRKKLPPKLFTANNGIGLINKNDSHDGTFVHQGAKSKSNRLEFKRRAGKRETLELNVIKGAKGTKTVSVTVPGDGLVQVSPYTADRRPFRSDWFHW